MRRGSEDAEGVSGSPVPDEPDMIREIRHNLFRIKLKDRWDDGPVDMVLATRT